MKTNDKFSDPMDAFNYFADKFDELIKLLRERNKPKPVVSLYYSVKQAAQRLGVSVRTVGRYEHDGKLQRVKVKGLRRLLFLKNDVDNFAERNRQETGKQVTA